MTPVSMDISDVLISIGLLTIVGGVAAYSRPAGLIVFGFIVLFIGVGSARRTPKAG